MTEWLQKRESGWVTVPMPPVAEGVAWHYTNAAGLFGILESQVLWASSPIVLNDRSELRFGLEVLRGAWKQLRGEMQPAEAAYVGQLIEDDLLADMSAKTYIFSASRENDLLSQWTTYAQGDGFAIGIRTGPGWVGAALQMGVPTLANWREVVYEPDRQRTLCTALLRYIAGAAGIDGADLSQRLILQTFIPFLKHEGFKDEREVRIVASLPAESTKFRVAGGRLVPYIEMPGPGRAAGNLLPVAEVRCGPTASDGAETIVRALLSRHGYGDTVLVTRSNIPFVA